MNLQYQFNMHWGLAALRSLSIIQKGTRHCNFQSNEPLSMFLRQLLLYEVPWTKTKIIWGGGSSCPLVTLTFKKGTRNSDYQSNESSEIYTTILSIRTLYSLRASLTTHVLTNVGGGAEKNGYLKIWLDVFWKVMGVGWVGGLVAFQSYRLLKRTLALSISNRMSRF